MRNLVELKHYRKPVEKREVKETSVITPELRSALERINKLMSELKQLAQQENTCSAPRTLR